MVIIPITKPATNMRVLLNLEPPLMKRVMQSTRAKAIAAPIKNVVSVFML